MQETRRSMSIGF